MKASNFLPITLFLLLAITLATVTNLSSKASFMPSMVGKNVENFQSEDLMTGGGFSSEEFLNNDITILNLFASWCENCQAEHEVIKKLTEQGFKVYGLDVADTKDKAMEYLKTHGNPYKKVGFDPQQRVAIAMGATGVPETFIIDRTGKIYFHQRGMIDADIVKRQMIPIMEGIKNKQSSK